MFTIPARPLPRRTLLKGLGAALALPLLDCMALPAKEPATGAAAGAATASGAPRRLLAINTYQGILPQHFFPATAGRDYAATPYLELLKEHRARMTVFSGVSLPQVDGGHDASMSFLTGAAHPNRPGFRNTISLDQYAAERLGTATRFPSLTLAVDSTDSLSVTAAGVRIPGEDRPSKVFKRMFLQGSPGEVDEQVARLRAERSMLDGVAARAKQLGARVGAGDRARLDQYFTSVRELERRLVAAEEWERKPKPHVDQAPPQDLNEASALIARTRLMFDLARLAFTTDSTRIITLLIHMVDAVPDVPGVTTGTHTLTHHGNQPDKLAMLKLIEEAQFRELDGLLRAFTATREAGGTLLDGTMVLYGTHMGSANAHSNDNLPVLLAGGGFAHGQHLAFDRKRNHPLTNLYVSLLHRLGLNVEAFSSSTGTMQGLEMV